MPLVLLLLALAVDVEELGSTPQFALQLVGARSGSACWRVSSSPGWRCNCSGVDRPGWVTGSWRNTLPALALVCFGDRPVAGWQRLHRLFVGGILFRGAGAARLSTAACWKRRAWAIPLALVTWVVFGAG